MKKRILHLSETSEPGGSETVLAYIAKNLDRGRYDSIVCLLEEGWLCGHLEKLGIEYIIIRNRYSYDPIFLRKLVSLIRERKIDLVHAHEFMMNIYGAVAAKIAGVPMIGTVHGKNYYPLKQRRIFLYKLAVSFCSRMITVSKDLEAFFINALNLANSRKITTIYNGIDLDKYNHNNDIEYFPGISENTVLGGTFGSLFEVKGIPYLLEAVKSIVAEKSDFKLLIAGEGDQEDKLRDLSKDLGLDNYVEFLGFRDDIPRLLQTIDIYICSSISEGLSLSILEAMAAGKPVVATAVGGNPELISNNENGLLVPSRDPDALAEKILYLINNKETRNSMGRMGREIAEKHFSLESMIDNYQDLYEELMK